MIGEVGPATIALLALAGFAAGFVDAIAGGGGLVTLPALLAVGLPPHLALGTNKGQAVFGAISSAYSFFKRGEMDRARMPIAFVFGFVGSCLGALALLAVRPEPLKPVVLVLLVAVAALLAARRDVTPRATPVPSPRLVAGAIALILGAYDGFFGPGVGSMLIVAFVLFLGDRLTRASGNAKVVNLASNIAAVLLFAWRGTVLWPLALPMAVANAIGAAVGARLAVKRGDKFVRVVVLSVVTLLVLKLASDLVHHGMAT